MKQEQELHTGTTTTGHGAVIAIHDLHKAFGSNVVLNGFDLELKQGECKVVLGKSGSGKSVLIKCIIGLLKPDSGNIHVLGKDILAMSHDELDQMRIHIGFLFQSNALYDSMTVRENLEFPMRRHSMHVAPEEAEERVMEALTNVGLAHTVDMMPAELSGGMKKRVALARTLILRPDIILYDEPTSGLDPITSREIVLLMKEIQKKYNTSSIVISHDMNCVKAVSDSVAVLLDGKCYKEGSFDMLKESDDERIQQFFE